MTADDTTHPPAPMPTERGTAVENESEPCATKHPDAGCADVGCNHNCEDWIARHTAPVEAQVEAMLRIQREYEAAEAAELGAGDMEALANVLGDIRLAGARQADWWESDDAHPLLIRALRAECVPWAEGLLASDWLDAVRRKAADDRAEQAWDDGEKAGMQNHSAYQNTGRPAHVNPYRAARIARETR